MTPRNTVHTLDIFDFLRQIETDSVNLVFLDPPYNIGIFCKMPPGEYLAWCKAWLAEVDRVLADNGALWICHKDPGVLVDLSRMVDGMGRGRRNWICWDKYNGNPTVQICGGPMVGMTQIKGLRSFQVMAEYLVYHADEGDWTRQCDKERGFVFEPLRGYLVSEFERAGMLNTSGKIAANVACGFSATSGGMASRHYFSRSQWCLPTAEHYQALRELLNQDQPGKYLKREYESLKEEYDKLKASHEHTRYTFNNPGRISSVWQIPPATKSPHPTPKPELLLERIILVTSNPGDLVVDPFCGSGITGVVAQNLGRDYLLNDKNERWSEYACERLRVKRLL